MTFNFLYILCVQEMLYMCNVVKTQSILIRLLSLFVYIMNKTGTAVNKVKSLLKSWQAFAGFHTQAASSGH